MDETRQNGNGGRTRRRRQTIRRRRLLLLLAACVALVAAVLGAQSGGGTVSGEALGATPSPSPTKPPPAVWVATAARPARIWAGGDSLGGELGWGLKPLLAAAGVFKSTFYYKESSGICRYDFFNWRTKMSSVMSRTGPDAVALMLGTNDTQSVWTSSGWIAYGSSDWKTAYARRVGTLMDTMLKGDARRIYWVGMPIMRESWRNSRMKVVNSVFRAEAKKRPGVEYIDIWALFADADGKYVARWRGSDGVHFSTDGWQRLGRRVYRAIKADWLPAATPSPSPSGSPSPAGSPSPSGSPAF
jgi:uncharacterized protein